MKTNKIISILAITVFFSMNTFPVYSMDIPTPPSAPEAPEAPSAPSVPTPPPSPLDPQSPVPTTPPSPSDTSPTSTPKPPKPTKSPESTPTPLNPSPTQSPNSPTTSSTISPTPTGTPPNGNQSGGQSSIGQSGDNSIITGSANNSALVVTEGNSNSSTTPVSDSNSGSGIQVINDENGGNSSNDGSVVVVENSNSIQENSASVQNNLTQSSISGANSVSVNTGGDSSIVTGDSNVSGTAITSVNTNIDGVSVSEFNISDDHKGDYVLDFSASCIINCSQGNTSVSNAGNGSGSTNSGSVATFNSDAAFQNNDATVGNNLVLKADSGNNDTIGNTGGDSNIVTGDANVSANALTFANNNISGNVIYGVVNIYGDLLGDIVFPEEIYGGVCCSQDVSSSNISNGSDSINNTSVEKNKNDSTVQTNGADIGNTVNINANSGDNSALGNTNGSSKIVTGDSSSTAQVLNVANNNLVGEDMWLVLVNNAGSWTGQIIGENTSNNFAGSIGTIFSLSPTGEITASNTGNGLGSQNSSTLSQNTNTNVVQSNQAVINNNLDLSANTGNNDSSFNTGGSSNIQTGDAKVVANLVNFVNNNLSGGGRLMVTVVNVFGNWVGNLVTPGSTKLSTENSDVATKNNSIGGLSEILPTTTPNTTTTNNSSSTIEYVSPTKEPVKNLSTTGTLINTKYSNQEVAGYFTDVTESDQQSIAAAAYNIESTNPSKRKTISINLAWLLPILPIIVILRAIKARRLSKLS